MSLQTYAKKRNFGLSPEPRPENSKSKRQRSEPIFVVQLHHARARHYDFRLQVGDALRSWAVPKGPSFDPSVKRLAVEVEDHPLSYASFEGDIPAGHYGAGHVDVFDRGTWSTADDAGKQLSKGHLKFELHGGKLHGAWHLVRTNRQTKQRQKQPQWMLFKAKDEFAGDITADDLLEDAAQRPAASKPKAEKRKLRTSGRVTNWARKALEIDGAKRSKFIAGAFEPELATSVASAPDGDEWLHETKWDGYRLLATIERGKARLWSRNALEWTAKAGVVATALASLPVTSAQLDGELIVGTADPNAFNELQAVLAGESNAPLVYALFDLMYVDGVSLHDCALVERKRLLQEIVASSPTTPLSKHLLVSEHHLGDGAMVFDAAAKRGLEGIISKRAASKYVAGRGRDWLKVKTSLSDEFAVVGYTKGRGRRRGFGALLLARPNRNGGWDYAGRIGSGFSESLLHTLAAKFPALHSNAPTVDESTLLGRDLGKPQWLQPKFVIEAFYRGIAKDGLLRQPSLKALREDKDASDLQTDAKSGNAKAVKASQPKRVTAKKASKRSVADQDFGFLTHPERVVFPKDGYTKLQVAQYYEGVMAWLLPQIENRPLSLVRCPDGANAACFFQKHYSPQIGKYVRSIRLRDSHSNHVNFIAVDSAAGVRDLVQMNVLELHPWGAQADRPNDADLLVFDLDPGPGVGWSRIVEAAELLRSLLSDLNLKSFVKLSGGKGMHVALPLNPPQPWTMAKAFCRQVAASLASHQPKQFVDVATKAKRNGKIFIDYLRNSRGATSVAAYSLRARPGAPVAMPIEWDDLKKTNSGNAFTLDNTLQHLSKRRRDPWQSMASLSQTFDATLQALIAKDSSAKSKPRKRSQSR